jgi:hydroxyacylglutathione hydrolase
MKKKFKRVLWTIGIVVAMMVLFSAAYLLKFQSETKKMHPIETKEIVENIFSINDSFVNMFLIKDNDQYVAIDAGNNSKAVLKELKKLNINPDKIMAVMLTHTDGDHVAALKLLKNAKIYFSRPEEQMINGKKSRFLFIGNKISSKNYSLLDDQQIVFIGKTKIVGILTPGHTAGSMCYLINDRYLFTGDALSLKDGKIDNFNNFFNVDSKEATQSMSKITTLPGAEYILTAHYGYTSDYKNAVKDWAGEHH